MKFALRAIQKIGIDRLLEHHTEKGNEGEPLFIINPMVNGREQGFLIIKNDLGTRFEQRKAIIFSEHRITDQLRVIWGEGDNFDWLGKGFLKQDKEHEKLSDHIFKTQEKTFPDFDEGVKFIEDFLGLSKELLEN